MAFLIDKRLKLKNAVQQWARSFVLGDAVVDYSMSSMGVSPDTFSPEMYGEYIATSNSVYTCATGRSDLLITLKPKLYRIKSDGDRQEVLKGDLYKLLKKVNPYWTFQRLVQMTELSLCLWGSCFWFLERGENGRQKPREIWWGKPSRVTVYPDPENYIKKFSYTHNGEEIFYEPSEVIWFHFPNPIDEFAGLSPLAAARLSADYASDAIKSNRNLFKNGNLMGGVVVPKINKTLSLDEAHEIENQLDKRSRGVDKAHRWSVFRFEADLHSMGISPKDAEFLGGLKWSLEEVCRAYKWPLDLVGGQRTYENFNAAMKAAYTHAVIPEGRFISSELTEQLLPMFPGEADEMEFDHSGIEVLQEQETDEWNRSMGQIEKGAITVNEWRKSKGKEPVPWGDTWWASFGLVAAEDLLNGPMLPAQQSPAEETNQETEPRSRVIKRAAPVEYNSEEHQRLWAEHVRKTETLEKRFTTFAVALFEQQQQSILDKLNQRAAIGVTTEGYIGVTTGGYPNERGLLEDIFNLKEWVKKFRIGGRRIFGEVMQEVGGSTIESLGVSLAFDIERPDVVRYIERMSQRFAKEINETTYKNLKASLAEAEKQGEGIDKISERVKAVMGDRIESTPEVIARTEINTASNAGTLLAYKQSGVVSKKGWLAALDGRERESHRAAHQQYQKNPIDLDEDFLVGNGRGPAPGQIGLPEEDIQCRCTTVPVVE